MRSRVLLFLAAILAFSGIASAGVIYSDLPSFLGAVQPGYYLEDFNSLSPTQYPPPESLPFSGNGFAYTASAMYGLYLGPAGADQLFGANFSNQAVAFVFTGANVTAIGGSFFVTDSLNHVLAGNLTLTLSDGTIIPLVSGSPVPFAGYTSDVPLTSLVVTGMTSETFVTLDNFYVGAANSAPVPEPATWALLCGAIPLFFALKRRARLTA
ncbi:MAG: PEP-CTERM sorting domain-containing protein [Acidobacteriota bacterium]